MKSASSLKRLPDKVFPPSHRRRLLKRKTFYRPFDGGDIGYVYAACKRGAVLRGIEPGLAPAEFKEAFFQRIAAHRAVGGDILTVIGHMPLGLFEINAAVDEGINPQAAPHAIWFPEASQRNKLEAWVRLLEQLRFAAIVIVPEAEWRFFDHIKQYGVLRTVGRFKAYLADGSDAKIYQGNG